jgi:hypothetical protein
MLDLARCSLPDMPRRPTIRVDEIVGYTRIRLWKSPRMRGPALLELSIPNEPAHG